MKNIDNGWSVLEFHDTIHVLPNNDKEPHHFILIATAALSMLISFMFTHHLMGVKSLNAWKLVGAANGLEKPTN